MKLTKEQQDIICQNVIHGERLTEITDKHNINIEQVFIELESESPEYSEFQERYARAERIRQHRLIDKIFRLSQKLIVCEDKEEYRKLKLELDIYKWIIRNEKSEVRIGQNDNGCKNSGVLSKTEIKSKNTEQKASKMYSAKNTISNKTKSQTANTLSCRGLPDKEKPETNRPLQEQGERYRSPNISEEERKKKGENFLWLEDLYPNG